MTEHYPESVEPTQAGVTMSAAERLQTWISEHPQDGYLRSQAHSILTDPKSLRAFEERYPGRPLTLDEQAAMQPEVSDESKRD